MVLFRWWHRNVRILTKPKPARVAEKWHTRFSIVYAFLAWNAVGFSLYGMSCAKKKELSLEERAKLSPAEQVIQERGLTNAKIIRVNKGFTIEEVSAPAEV